MPFISSVRGSYGAQGRFSRGIMGISATGGSTVTSGGYKYHLFSSVGTTSFVSTSSGTIQVLVVGGGGGGDNDHGGGGGAGGVLYHDLKSIRI